MASVTVRSEEQISKSLSFFAASAISLDTSIPGVPEMSGRLLSECGLTTIAFFFGIVWLAIQLAKTRKGWEDDRAGMMKLYAGQNEAYEKIAESHARLEGIIFTLRGPSHIGDDN